MCNGLGNDVVSVLGAAKYWFRHGKRSNEDQGIAESVNSTECSSTRKPDALITTDGKDTWKYNVTGLDAATRTKLVSSSMIYMHFLKQGKVECKTANEGLSI